MEARLRRAVPVGIALALVVTAGAGPLRVDPARSQLVVRTYKDGFAARLAHDHVVQAGEVAGVIEYDPATPETASVAVEVATASLRVDEPALRARFNLAGEPSAADRAEIEKAMRSPAQLDVGRYPTMRFASNRIARQPDGRYLVTGTLTIRGVAREVSFPAEVTLDGATLRARAVLAITQSSFGYPPYRALLGAIKNKDEVTLHVDLVAAP